MIIESQNFGTIEYDDDSIISFDDGLIGFPLFTKFVIFLLDLGDNDCIYALQSVEEPLFGFVIMNVSPVLRDYAPSFDEPIGLCDVYNIATVGDSLEETTVNLKAPILINMEQKSGRQLITNSDYPIKFHIFKSPSWGGA